MTLISAVGVRLRRLVSGADLLDGTATGSPGADGCQANRAPTRLGSLRDLEFCAYSRAAVRNPSYVRRLRRRKLLGIQCPTIVATAKLARVGDWWIGRLRRQHPDPGRVLASSFDIVSETARPEVIAHLPLVVIDSEDEIALDDLYSPEWRENQGRRFDGVSRG